MKSVSFSSNRLLDESITEDRMLANLSKTKNIPSNAVIFSDFCLPLSCHRRILVALFFEGLS